MAEVAECADVRDDERHAELILRTDLAESDAAVFDRETAAAPVVADLHKLVLQCIVGDVVADASGGVESFAVEAAVAEESPNLIGERLQDRAGLQTEVRDGGEELAVGLHFEKSADSGDFLEIGVILKYLLGIVAPAGSDPEIADDGRPVDGPGSKGERRDGVQRLKDVSRVGAIAVAVPGTELKLAVFEKE